MLTPLPGESTSQIFENEFLDIRPAIVYYIEIPLKTFEYDGREVDTSRQLRRIWLRRTNHVG
jgi:hypothetical protein